MKAFFAKMCGMRPRSFSHFTSSLLSNLSIRLFCKFLFLFTFLFFSLPQFYLIVCRNRVFLFFSPPGHGFMHGSLQNLCSSFFLLLNFIAAFLQNCFFFVFSPYFLFCFAVFLSSCSQRWSSTSPPPPPHLFSHNFL